MENYLRSNVHLADSFHFRTNIFHFKYTDSTRAHFTSNNKQRTIRFFNNFRCHLMRVVLNDDENIIKILKISNIMVGID